MSNLNKNVIRLSELDIECLINGESITVTLPNKEKVIITQKLSKDISMPIKNRDKKVVSQKELKSMINNTISNSIRMSMTNGKV